MLTTRHLFVRVFFLIKQIRTRRYITYFIFFERHFEWVSIIFSRTRLHTLRCYLIYSKHAEIYIYIKYCNDRTAKTRHRSLTLQTTIIIINKNKQC